MTTIQDLNELLPDVKSKAEALLAGCAAAGLSVRIFETYRSFERQQELYAQGRTAPGSIVTRSVPGSSWHQWRRAFDVVFEGPQPWGEQHPWMRLGHNGEAVGLEWGGTWRKPDRPHFQVAGRVGLGLRTLAHAGTVRKGVLWGPYGEQLQQHLQAAGCNPGRIDGVFGPRTEDAVQELQLWGGLTPSGIVDMATIEVIEQKLAKRKDGQG